MELFLKGMGIDPVIQQSALFRVSNIIVDFSAGTQGKILLFSAHYDALKGSPGANDNASGTAVLLGLCRKLKDARVPVRVVFFDGEEAWLRMPFLRLGLRGSLYYVCRNNPRDVAALYNLEYCGRGDFLCAWPVEDRNKNLPSLKAVEKSSRRFKH